MSEIEAAAASGLPWKAEFIRATVFWAQPRTEWLPWWLGLAGEEPAVSNRQPKLGVQIDEGSWHLGQLALVQMPDRCDWVYKAKPTTDEGFDLLGGFPGVAAPFIEAVSNWLGQPTHPPISRLGLGMALITPADSVVQSYEMLAGQLDHVKLCPDEDREFLYRVNRRRSSKAVAGLAVNRLTTWSSISQSILNITISDGQGRASVPVAGGFGARLEMDINSVQEFQRAFERDELLPLFVELLGLATELARDGEVR